MHDERKEEKEEERNKEEEGGVRCVRCDKDGERQPALSQGNRQETRVRERNE